MHGWVFSKISSKSIHKMSSACRKYFEGRLRCQARTAFVTHLILHETQQRTLNINTFFALLNNSITEKTINETYHLKLIILSMLYKKYPDL